MSPTELPGVIAEHIAAVNAFDIDAIVATFAPDAYVNDARRDLFDAGRQIPAGATETARVSADLALH